MKSVDIAILGAGPAGLCAAMYAQKLGLTYCVLESSDKVGGNAQTFEQDGFLFDSGAHRLHAVYPELLDELLSFTATEVHKVSSPSAVVKDGQVFDFPIRWGEVLIKSKLGDTISYGKDFFTRPDFDGQTFKSFAEAKYGKGIAEDFLLKYTEKLWGADPAKLSYQIAGKRFEKLSFAQLFKKKGHLEGDFLYPNEGGIGKVWNDLLARLDQDTVQLRNKVVGLSRESKGWRVDGKKESISAKKVISTLPISVLANLLQIPFESLEFRDLKLNFFGLNKEDLGKKASYYFPESKYPFNRITEPKIRASSMAPLGKTSICVETPLSQNDSEPESQDVIALLEDLKFLHRDEIISTKEVILPNAYPILTIDQMAKVKALRASIETHQGIYLLGRNADFSYSHIHDQQFHAKKLVTSLSES